MNTQNAAEVSRFWGVNNKSEAFGKIEKALEERERGGGGGVEEENRGSHLRQND